MVERENILVVGVDAETYDGIASVLKRISFDVDRIPTASAGLELATLVGFRAIILNHPLKTMSTEDFLTGLKAPESESRTASVAALVTAADTANRLAAPVDGFDVVIESGDDPSATEKQLCALLGIAHRTAIRVMVKIEAKVIDNKNDTFVAQTKDLSTTGFFAITNRLAPVGSHANVTFNFPGELSPFVAKAEVARHATGSSAAHQGMGLRFLGFNDGHVTRLSRFLESQHA